MTTYVDDVQRLLHRGLGVKAEPGVDLCADLSGDELQDLLAKLDEQSIESSVDLVIRGLAVRLAVLDRIVHELGVLGLFRGGEDEGGVGRGILRRVL